MADLYSISTPIKKDIKEVEKLDLISISTPISSQSFEDEKKPDLLSVSTPLEKGSGKETWAKMGMLYKVLDVIGRPGYAIKSMLDQAAVDQGIVYRKHGVTNEDYLKMGLFDPKRKAIADDIRAKDFDVKRRLEAAWKGFSGEERIMANDIWKKLGVEDIPLLGFVTELALDPLMYGGYNAIVKGIGKAIKPLISGTGKILGAVEKGVERLPWIGPRVEKVAQELPSVLGKLKERFVTKSGIKKLDELTTKWLSKRRYLKGKEFGKAVKVRNSMQNIAKKTGRSVEETRKRVVNLIELRNYPDELAKVVANPTTEERLLSNIIKNHFDEMLMKEMAAGVPISGLSGVRTERIAKLRKNLNVLRSARSRELEVGRKAAIREINVIAELKTRVVERGMLSRKHALQATISKEKVNNIRRLDDAIVSVEKQMKLLEQQHHTLLVAGKSVKRVSNNLDKLENQYWYLHSEMAERLIPEGIKGPKVRFYLKQLEDVEKMLKADITVNLGGRGVTLAERVIKAEREMGKLATTPIGLPIGKPKSLLKQLTVERAKRDFGYFPRITTPEAIEYLKQVRIGKTKVWNTSMNNALKRRTEDFTLEEFNSFVEGLGLKSLGGKQIEQFFMSNPSYGIAARGARSAKAITSASFLDEVGKAFGVDLKTAPGFYVELPQRVTKLNPGLRGKWFDPEIAGEVSKMTQSYLDPNQARLFVKWFDTVQNSWKRWTLAPFPKYHLRNMVGNTWNIYLEGSTRPNHFVKMQALQTYRKYSRSPHMGNIAKSGLKRAGITESQAVKWIDEMEQLGVLGQGWYAADIQSGARQAIGRKGLTEFGMSVGTTIENNARGALWLARLDKGDDVLKASISVKKHLFDYADLTSFERDVMKRLFPFYTWTRKNIPLQLEYIWTQPQKFAPLAAMMRKGDVEDILRLKYARPDVYDRLPVEIRRDSESVTYIPLEGLLPAGDLAKLVRPQEIFFDLLSPYLRAPLELRFNKSLFFESEIEKYPEATQELLRLDIPVRIKYLLTTVLPQARLLSELNKLVSKRRKGVELEGIELAFQHTLSSVYKVTLEDLKRRALGRLKSNLQDLNKGARWAKDNDRQIAFDKIMLEIRKTQREMEKIR